MKVSDVRQTSSSFAQDDLYWAATKAESGSLVARKVLNYSEALYAGFKRMKAQQYLLLTGTIVDIVQTIKRNRYSIRNTPGTAMKKGKTGETIYTPPYCQNLLRNKLSALERFIYQPDDAGLDALVKMVLIHYKVEAIHPFADGIERTGSFIHALYLIQQELFVNQQLMDIPQGK